MLGNKVHFKDDKNVTPLTEKIKLLDDNLTTRTILENIVYEKEAEAIPIIDTIFLMAKTFLLDTHELTKKALLREVVVTTNHTPGSALVVDHLLSALKSLFQNPEPGIITVTFSTEEVEPIELLEISIEFGRFIEECNKYFRLEGLYDSNTNSITFSEKEEK